ncbi:sensor histidine kinase [Pseudoalteromonas sp. MTN2-4]
MNMLNKPHNMALAHPNKKFWNWGPLFFSSFFFFPLLTNWQSLSVGDITAQLAIYAFFVFLYGIALYKKGESVTPSLAAMALLCCLGTYVTYGTHSLFGFIGFFCGFNYRRKQSFMMMAALLVVIFISAFLFVPVKSLYFVSPAAIVSIGLFIFGMMEQRERLYRDQQAKDQQQIEQLGAIAERERIARDLHDLLGHSLSSIALKAELASKLTAAGANEQASQESEQVAQLARDLLSEVRQAVSGLKQVGLYAQIDVLVARLQDAGFIVEQSIDRVVLSAEQESNLCFIFKEAVTNIIRHSKGKYVKLQLSSQSGVVELQIKDDGIVKKYQCGNGVEGIKDRVATLQGQFDISTDSGMAINIQFKERVV